MTPTLVTAPVSTPVDLADLKAHLRVDHDDDDATLAALMASAVAHLDGWTGVLGRAIMPQEWAVTLDEAGEYTLPMPDVTAATVDYGNGAAAIEWTSSPAGPVIEVTGPATVAFTVAMPATLLPVAQNAVRFLVERDFDRPIGPAYDAITRTIGGQVSAIRWRRV